MIVEKIDNRNRNRSACASVVTTAFFVVVIITLQIVATDGSSNPIAAAAGRRSSLSSFFPTKMDTKQRQRQDELRHYSTAKSQLFPLRGGGISSSSSSSSKTYPPSPFWSSTVDFSSGSSRRLVEQLRTSAENGRAFISNNVSTLTRTIFDKISSSNNNDTVPRRQQHKQNNDSNNKWKRTQDTKNQQKSSHNLRTSSLAIVMSELSSPTRIIRVIIIAFGVAEILDRMGVLYEDTPEVIKSQIDAWWQLDMQPFLFRCADIARSVWRDTIVPYVVSLLTTSSDSTGILVLMNDRTRTSIERAVYRFRYYVNQAYINLIYALHNNSKIAFAVGATSGMVTFPIACSWILKYAGVVWTPLVAVYAAAEAHHWCKLNGIRSIVDWLGDTPQTIGSVLDDVLERWRWWVRKRTPWATTSDFIIHSNSLLKYNKSSYQIMWQDGSQSSSSAVVSPNHPQRPRLASGIETKKRKSSAQVSGDDSRDMQELLEDFKAWMVVQKKGTSAHGHLYMSNGVNGKHTKPIDADWRQTRRRNKFIKQGFAFGCLLGFALLDQK
jgi:hypothetical protein